MPRSVWPPLDLPVKPPLSPMEATLVTQLPAGDDLYEPKWDGFRCLAFRAGDAVALQSKNGQDLTRYFPEVVAALAALPLGRFVLDGELIAASFDDLLSRIHPAASRIERLSADRPAWFAVFDLLVDASGQSLMREPLANRRQRLESLAARAFSPKGHVRLSPATRDRQVAQQWLGLARGVDGVMAKRLSAPYTPGERTAMVKVKCLKTADCVVGGYRKGESGEVMSLLLGLYDDQGLLHHVGFCSAFKESERPLLAQLLSPYEGGRGFTGKAPGGPSRWRRGRPGPEGYVPLAPTIVAEVRYDLFSEGRFRHGTRLLRWRPDKDPRQCTLDQVQTPGEPRSLP